MAYEIVAYYGTGDSFKSYNTSTTLSPTWENLEIARKALTWLDEHHKYYDAATDRWSKNKFDISDVQTKPWYRDIDGWHDSWQMTINLPLDDGTLHAEHIPYHGYFEQLTHLEIENVKDDLNSRQYS